MNVRPIPNRAAACEGDIASGSGPMGGVPTSEASRVYPEMTAREEWCDCTMWVSCVQAVSPGHKSKLIMDRGGSCPYFFCRARRMVLGEHFRSFATAAIAVARDRPRSLRS